MLLCHQHPNRAARAQYRQVLEPLQPGDLPEGCTTSGKGGFSVGFLFHGGGEILGTAPGRFCTDGHQLRS